jgi:hypothetical protein
LQPQHAPQSSPPRCSRIYECGSLDCQKNCSLGQSPVSGGIIRAGCHVQEIAANQLLLIRAPQSLKSFKEQYIEIMEQIHEIFIALITLYESTQIMGVLPPNILSQIVDFTEYVFLILLTVPNFNGTF